MSTTDSAFRTSDPDTIEAFHKFQADCIIEQRKRNALMEEFDGRNLWINRSGFGHGTVVVGFERREEDKDNDLLFDGALIVSTKRGFVVPNRKRKAGKELAVRLNTYHTPDLEIPGMPAFHIGTSGMQLAVHAPALWVWPSGQDEVLFAFWSTTGVAEQMGEQWEEIPMSTYYLAKEQHDGALEADEIRRKRAVSGNEGDDD